MVNHIRILRRVRHEGAIRLYEVYESEQYVHLILESLKGQPLFMKIRSSTTYSEADAAKLVRELMVIVSYCHEKQIVHRDLHPEIIYLS